MPIQRRERAARAQAARISRESSYPGGSERARETLGSVGGIELQPLPFREIGCAFAFLGRLTITFAHVGPVELEPAPKLIRSTRGTEPSERARGERKDHGHRERIVCDLHTDDDRVE